MARNDLMTALLDTRRALEEQVAALGERLESVRRELAETVTSRTADLHADNRETRNRVNSMSTALSEANKSAPALRNDVTDLARSLQALRGTVENLAARLPDAPGWPAGDALAPHAFDHAQEPAESPSRAASESPAEPDLQAAKPEGAQPVSPGNVELQAEQQRAAAALNARSKDAVSSELRTPAEPGPDQTELAKTERAGSSTSDDSGSRSLARHDNVLGSAATVGTVNIVCHREMWEFVQERAADIPHFRAPASLVEEGQDRIRAVLSGRSVIGVLIAMRATQAASAPYGKDDGTWALSHAVYDRLAHDLATTSRKGRAHLTVVFDDGFETEPTPAPSQP